MSGFLFAQSATEIIRTSDNAKLVTVLQNGNVGIGVVDPMSRLHVAGATQMTGFKMLSGATYGYVLTSDATGSGTWQATQLVGVGGTGITGYLSRFNGTSTIHSSVLYQDEEGEIGIGTETPSRALHIYSSNASMKIENPTTNSNPSLYMDNDVRQWQVFVDGGNNMTDGFAIRDVNAGAERFIINTNGNVAIGDFTPVSKLHVGGTVRADAFSSNSPLLLQTDDVTRIYADDITGHVGIGITTPPSRLSVSGGNVLVQHATNTRITSIHDNSSDGIAGIEGYGTSGDVDLSGGFILASAKGASKHLSGIGDNDPYLLIRSSVNDFHIGHMLPFLTIEGSTGNVGIGTMSPMSLLHVAGTAEMSGIKMPTGAVNNYVLTTNGSGVGSWQPTQLVGIGGSGAINYLPKFTGSATLGSSGIYEDGSGNVGIGTTTPQQLLVVRGNETASGEQFQISNTSGTLRTWGIGVNSSTGGFTIRDETGSVNPISIAAGAASGSISVGTQSISLLTGGVASFIRFSTNATERLRIDVNGNTGIGTTTPAEKLDVIGAVQMTGFRLPTGATNNYVLTSDASGIGTWQQAPGAGTSGTTNYISKFTGTNTLGNSGIYEDGSGNVGIGTTTPQQLLVVRGNETASGEQFQISNTSGTLRTWGIGVNSSTGGLTIRDETGSVNPISIAAGAASGSISVGTQSISLLTGGVASFIRFSTNATERARIDVNGNMGIGTTTPVEKLDVMGTVRASAFTSSSPLLLQTNGTTRIYADESTGDVGIGTNTPQMRLHVAGGNMQVSNAVNTRLTSVHDNSTNGIAGVEGYGSSGDVSLSGGFILASAKGSSKHLSGIGDNDPYLLIRSSVNDFHIGQGSPYMTVDGSTGRIGIGTTNPTEMLEVSGTLKASALNITGTTVFSNPVGIATSPEGSSHLHVAGNVSLNSNNQLKLDGGSGSSMIRYNTTGSLTEFFCYFGGGFAFNQGGTPLMRILSGGNVGIGTTTPSEKLEVSGTVKASALDITGTTVFSNPVGIATSPEGSSHLHVAGNVSLNSNNQLKLDGGSGSSMIRYNTTGSLTEFFCYFGGGFAFNQGGSPLMRIKSTGDVGIGTTTPEHKLDIAGGLRSSGDMTIGPGTDKALWFNRNEATYTRARIGFYWDGSSNNLDLAAIDGTSDLETARILLTQNGTLLFRTSNAEAMRVESDGDIAIGTTSAANILTIEQTSATDPIADAWTTYSSRRWKTNIETLDDALSDVMKLRGVSYQWKADGKKDIGFVAEEVGEIYPEIVAYEENGIDAKSVDYSRLVAVLVEAVKDQQEIIMQQQEDLKSISARLEKLERLLSN